MAKIETLATLMRRVPGKAWLAAGGLLVGAFWLQQHDARIRQQARLEQVRTETAVQVAALRRQAAQDVKQANVENAKAIAEIERRRQQAEQQDRQLTEQLNRLRWQAHIQAGQVATLPISQIVTRVAAQLGFNAQDVAHGQTAGMTKTATPAPGAESKLQITNYELPKPGAASAQAGVGSRSLCDLCGPKALTQRAQRPSVSSVLDLFNPLSARRRQEQQITNYELPKPGAKSATAGDLTPEKQTAGILRSAQDDGGGAVDERGGAQNEKGGAQDDKSAAMTLTASGARKVEAALVALNACQAGSKIETEQVSNCQAGAEAGAAEVERLNSSVASLNSALAAKDQVLARQQSEYKAELRAARGTFLGRLARTAEQVAVGVAVGVAIGVAVK